jgi:protein-tyrosine phosphatase
MQRSACVVSAYLMAIHNMNFDQTYNYLKSRRPIVYTPNVNFKKSLISYYKNNLHKKDNVE